MIKGRVNSFQSLGAADGPGIRFVAFLQGCPLRCGCCHNPETREFSGGGEYTAQEIADKAERYKDYFGKKGGITLSGGEPLLQASFAAEIFKECHKRGINTCLDTSGCIINEEVKELLSHTDTVLLDIKYTDKEGYRENVGCEYGAVLDFLALLNEMKIKTVLRQVVIPTKNDKEENFKALKSLAEKTDCVLKAELLPFKKICSAKYENMGISFPFADLTAPCDEDMKKYNEFLK